jgi:hypothetical protein
MDLSFSLEANSHSASHKIPRLLWNPKVHCRVQKSPSLAPLLIQMNPIHTFPPTTNYTAVVLCDVSYLTNQETSLHPPEFIRAPYFHDVGHEMCGWPGSSIFTTAYDARPWALSTLPAVPCKSFHFSAWDMESKAVVNKWTLPLPLNYLSADLNFL